MTALLLQVQPRTLGILSLESITFQVILRDILDLSVETLDILLTLLIQEQLVKTYISKQV